MSHLSADQLGEAFDRYCDGPPLSVAGELKAGDRSGSHASFENQLTRGRNAPAHARRSISAWLAPALNQHELDTMRLLATELVTNAVLHGEGEIILKAHLNDGRALVEVLDQGNGFQETVPRRRTSDPPRLGLTVVDAESSRWGIQQQPTRVWFELELAPGIGTITNHPGTPLVGDRRL